MSETMEVPTPAQQLAKLVIERLKSKGLLGKEDAAKAEKRIADGVMQGADWKLLFEKSLDLHKQP
jgi:hypothetical protein